MSLLSSMPFPGYREARASANRSDWGTERMARQSSMQRASAAGRDYRIEFVAAVNESRAARNRGFASFSQLSHVRNVQLSAFQSGQGVHSPTAGRQRRFGFRAAPASSRRRTGAG